VPAYPDQAAFILVAALAERLLFASKALTSKRILKQAFVQDSDGIEGLGDHMPLVADFDL
jgi:hypothetical protein